MAKVFGIHELTLSPHAAGKEQEFERFMSEEHCPRFAAATGAEVRFLKGVRGDRVAKYSMLVEFPSVEASTRFYPLGPGPATEEGQRVERELAEAGKEYWPFVASSTFTDYVEADK